MSRHRNFKALMSKGHPRLRVALMFGARSVEHEISVITALQAYKALDPYLYEVFPVYIATTGKWYTGEALLKRQFYRSLPEGLESLQQITLLPEPGLQAFLPVNGGRIELSKPIPVDVCLLAFHGQYGEDGSVQGLLELADIPYTGSGVTASALAMHKAHCKSIAKALGIPVLPSALVEKEKVLGNFSAVRSKILSTPGLENFPLFIKPCKLGSSVGVARAMNEAELSAALAKALRYDDEVLVEPCIRNIMEINVSVLDGVDPRASVVEIPVAQACVLTYEDKYLRGGGKLKLGRGSEGMASLTRHIDPKELDSGLKAKATSWALEIFKGLGCSGVARLDFIYDLENEQLYFNELNSIPGSLSFYLWEKSHPPLLYTDLLHGMIERALEKKSQKLALERQMPFRALLTS